MKELKDVLTLEEKGKFLDNILDIENVADLTPDQIYFIQVGMNLTPQQLYVLQCRIGNPKSTFKWAIFSMGFLIGMTMGMTLTGFFL